MTSDLMHIADHYGVDTQSQQLVEEMAELTVALNKLRRGKASAVDNVIEEIADVEIMLEQIKYLLSITPAQIDCIKQSKIVRQLTRIKKI